MPSARGERHLKRKLAVTTVWYVRHSCVVADDLQLLMLADYRRVFIQNGGLMLLFYDGITILAFSQTFLCPFIHTGYYEAVWRELLRGMQPADLYGGRVQVVTIQCCI